MHGRVHISRIAPILDDVVHFVALAEHPARALHQLIERQLEGDGLAAAAADHPSWTSESAQRAWPEAFRSILLDRSATVSRTLTSGSYQSVQE